MKINLSEQQLAILLQLVSNEIDTIGRQTPIGYKQGLLELEGILTDRVEFDIWKLLDKLKIRK